MTWFYIIATAAISSAITTLSVSCLLATIRKSINLNVATIEVISTTNLILARSLAAKNGDTQAVEMFDLLIKDKVKTATNKE